MSFINKEKLHELFSTLVYLLSSVILVIISLAIMLWAVHEIILAFESFSQSREFIFIMLHSVGAVIISVAILDIAKYMIEEEVFRSKELRNAAEARKTLTKIMTIIAIAVSVEGLVYIFKAGTEDLTLLLYPALLIITSVIVIIGLGVYQKLSKYVES